MTSPKRLRDLINPDSGGRIAGDPDTLISGLQYDSRRIEPGDLFVALRGGYHDGHRFIDDAIRRGAVAVMVDTLPGTDIPALVVDDGRAALPEVASRFFDHPSRSLNIIGITGTDGKTTSSYLVDAVLCRAQFKTGLIGTVSVKIGGDVVEHETRQTTPESLEVQRLLRRMVDFGVQTAILEATSHGLALHRLDQIEFDIAAVTNITHEHLDFHGSVDAYRRAKAMLFERISTSRGHAIINLDDPGASAMRDFVKRSQVITYGIDRGDASVSAQRLQASIRGTSFDLVINGASSGRVELPMPGLFNVSNALCAAATAIAAGVAIDTIREALSEAPSVPGRMVAVDEGQPFGVIVDYAHTPDSLTKILTLLRDMTDGGRLICVSGSAGERDRVKRPRQGRVSAELADISVFTSEDPRFEDPEGIIEEIAAGAADTGAARGRDFFTITDRAEAVAFALGLAKPGDTVLLAGKGHERSIIIDDVKHPWDEEQEARKALRALGYLRR